MKNIFSALTTLLVMLFTVLLLFYIMSIFEDIKDRKAMVNETKSDMYIGYN